MRNGRANAPRICLTYKALSDFSIAQLPVPRSARNGACCAIMGRGAAIPLTHSIKERFFEIRATTR